MLVLKLKKVFPFLLLSFPVVIDIINGYLRGTNGTGESSIGILYRGMIILFSAIYLFRTKYSNNIKILILSSIAFINIPYSHRCLFQCCFHGNSENNELLFCFKYHTQKSLFS